MYKTGNAFASDIKRQIAHVRRALAPHGPQIATMVREPVLGADGIPIIQELADGTRAPMMQTVQRMRPAVIVPREYHRLAGVR